MVVSNINSNVSYPERKTIDEDDKGQDVSMFQIKLFDIDVVIALGNVKYNFSNKNVLYCPVYIIVDESDKIYQIGVYEILKKKYDKGKYLDEDGDLDISKLKGPLLYTFVDKSYIKKCMKNEILVEDESSKTKGEDEDEDEEEVEDQEEDDDENDDEEDEEEGKKEKDKDEDEEDDVEDDLNAETSSPTLSNPPPVLVDLNIEENVDDDDFFTEGETDKHEKKERKKYKKPADASDPNSWIQEYLHNNNYSVLDNEGGGDCFFAVIRDGFKNINKSISVEKLREMLTENTSLEQYQNYKERFTMLKNELTDIRRQIPDTKAKTKEIRKKFNKMVKKAKKEKDVPTQKQQMKEARQEKKKYNASKEKEGRLERDLKEAKRNWSDIKWMKGITSLDKLKSKMLTCNFWADSVTTDVLELVLNTKFIVISSVNWRSGTPPLICGNFVQQEVEEKGYFKPKYYIIMEHTGSHYKLIKYKGKGIFRFHEIPHGLKTQIVNRCMKSRGKSLYNYIPKFARLIGQRIEVPESKQLEELVGDQKKKDSEDGDVDIDMEDEGPEMTPTPTPEDGLLFSNDTHFVFYSKSSDKKPGMGAGEKIAEGDVEKYIPLTKMKNWRRVLSNMYVKTDEAGNVVPLFKLDGKNWASVEHYYHANKFKKNNPDFYNVFSMDSKSVICKDPKMALGAGGKTGIVRQKDPETKKTKIIFRRPKEVVMDEDFFDNKNNEKVMEKGQQAKYENEANEMERNVLLGTKDAKLLHYVVSRAKKEDRPPPVIFYDTMRIRHRIKKKAK
tara:strand:+ start:437 stop:2788 length:2352 start_codon:yes stop_codon:yes gene_type:complete